MGHHKKHAHDHDKHHHDKHKIDKKHHSHDDDKHHKKALKQTPKALAYRDWETGAPIVTGKQIGRAHV